MMEGSKRSTRTLVRAGFVALITFEYFGYLGFTPLTPIYSWVSLIITAFGAWAILEAVSLYVREYYSISVSGFLWILFLFFVMFDTAGDILHFYNKFKYYDNALHVFVSFLIVGPFVAWLIHEFNKRSRYFIRPTVSIYLIIASVTFFGFLYEVGEYLADTFLGTESIPGRLDSVEDMISNFLGGFIASLFFAWHQFRKKEFTSLPHSQ